MENYIFDFYGTLADIHTDEEDMQVWEKLRLFYGYHGAEYTPKELKKSYEKLVREKVIKQSQHEKYPEIRIEKVFEELFLIKGVQPEKELVLHTAQFFRILTIRHLRLYEGVPQMLEKLRKNGKKIYLLSNAQRVFTEYELCMLHIWEYFDDIFLSSDYGVKKPSAHFFEVLMKKHHLKPEECVMIGNEEESDIKGASALGITTCYIVSGEKKGSSEVLADHILDVTELEKISEFV